MWSCILHSNTFFATTRKDSILPIALYLITFVWLLFSPSSSSFSIVFIAKRVFFFISEFHNILVKISRIWRVSARAFILLVTFLSILPSNHNIYTLYKFGACVRMWFVFTCARFAIFSEFELFIGVAEGKTNWYIFYSDDDNNRSNYIPLMPMLSLPILLLLIFFSVIMWVKPHQTAVSAHSLPHTRTRACAYLTVFGL